MCMYVLSWVFGAVTGGAAALIVRYLISETSGPEE